MVVGTLLIALYVALDPNRGTSAVLYRAIGTAGVIVALIGIRRRRPPNAGAWYAFVAGMALWVVGDAVYAINGLVFHRAAYPSVADLFYLSAYPTLIVGLSLLARAGRGRA